MVHPIAGTNQYPFTINGIIVDGAKINGQTYVKDLFIYKQRSYNMYDLIDSSGIVYEFIEIVWYDKNKINLNYFDNSSFSVQFISDNTFFIKIQDIPRNIFGFITLMQSNKVKVSTGDYIYYNQNDDFSLLSVRCIPATTQVNRGESVTIDVSYLPLDYYNTSGKWTIENISDGIIKENGRSRTTSATFNCLKPGHAIVTFVPDANKMLTATAHIFVKESPQTYNTFEIYPRFSTSTKRYASPGNTEIYAASSFYCDDHVIVYFYDDIVTMSVVFTPYGYVPPSELELIYDSDIFEYIGTDNNIDYKFRVIKDVSGRQYITIKDGNISSSFRLYINELDDEYFFHMSGLETARVGEQYQYHLNAYYKSLVNNHIWSIDGDSSIATIDDNGLCTVHGEGDFSVVCTIEGTDVSCFTKVSSYENIPDFVFYKPNDAYAYNVGDTIQLEAFFTPEYLNVTGEWYAPYNSNGYYHTVSETGLLEINHVPMNQSMFVAGFKPDTSFPIYQNSLYKGNRCFYNEPEGVVITPNVLSIITTSTAVNIPLGEISYSGVYVGPMTSTVSRNWTFTVEDPSIVKVEQMPYQTNNYNHSYLYYTSLKKGSTSITVTVDNYPNLTKTFTVTVF